METCLFWAHYLGEVTLLSVITVVSSAHSLYARQMKHTLETPLVPLVAHDAYSSACQLTSGNQVMCGRVLMLQILNIVLN